MSQGTSNMGTIVGICFMIVWCSAAFGMGLMALQFGAPFFFVLVPFGMGGFGIVFCIAMAKGGGQSGVSEPLIKRGSRTYAGDYMQNEQMAYTNERRPTYVAPDFCPSCGASISTEEVDWVRPLKAVCPHCEAIIDAVEKPL